MSSAAVPLVCLLSVLPGPPGISYDGGYLHALPINKHKCPLIDPRRDIMFELYTKYNPLRPQRLYLGDDVTLAASHMDFARPTLIYVHAYMESTNTESPTRIREAVLVSDEAYNLILVDAPRLEAGPWYPTAAANTQAIGIYLARFVQYLTSRGLSLASLHIVGHSLGAQSAGVAGAALGGRVARITGLDPARPKFARQPLARQLDRGDAAFVDIIHTDAGIFGNGAPLGHVDFYPNGGITLQPGCDLKSLGPNAMLVVKVFCSHRRSYEFFAESILNPGGFLARPCTSWRDFKAGTCGAGVAANMGFGVDRKLTGRDCPCSDKSATRSHPAQPCTTAPAQNVETVTFNPSSTDKQELEKHATSQIDVNESKEADSTKSTHRNYKTTKQPKSMTLLKTKKISTKHSDVPKFREPQPSPTITRMFPKFLNLNPNSESEIAHAPILKTPNLILDTIDLKPIGIPDDPKLTDNSDSQTPKFRKKRSIFRTTETPILLGILQFLVKTGRIIVPVVSLIRDIDTSIQSGNDKIQHVTRERQSFFGVNPTLPAAVPALNLRLGKEPAPTLLQRLFKLNPSTPSGIFVNI